MRSVMIAVLLMSVVQAQEVAPPVIAPPPTQQSFDLRTGRRLAADGRAKKIWGIVIMALGGAQFFIGVAFLASIPYAEEQTARNGAMLIGNSLTVTGVVESTAVAIPLYLSGAHNMRDGEKRLELSAGGFRLSF